MYESAHGLVVDLQAACCQLIGKALKREVAGNKRWKAEIVTQVDFVKFYLPVGSLERSSPGQHSRLPIVFRIGLAATDRQNNFALHSFSLVASSGVPV